MSGSSVENGGPLSKHIDPHVVCASAIQRKEMEEVKVVEGLNGAGGVKRDKHPVWYPPTAFAAASCQRADSSAPFLAGLHVLNSLTETVEPFIPRSGRCVKWYTCGPTVYETSHLGHARAYLTFDIVRRIMEDYFGYSVFYQMNVTDIDDKIIKRARVSKLLDDFRAELRTTLKDGEDGAWEKLVSFTKQAQQAAEEGLASRRAALSLPLAEGATSRQRTEREEKLLELDLKTSQLSETMKSIAEAKGTLDVEKLFSAAAGVNGELLDAIKGDQITDQGIFDSHARKYERLFFEDMQRLGIREPDVVTRVTEYVPQVVDFIVKIMDNGFAYKGETSVFFDTEAYSKAGHSYPKLKPGGDKNTTEDEMNEGEGALSKGIEGEKRSPNDFALWKFSKAGEPRWPSPWGDGRPGWHIECSVMASDILGDNMDIHGGGWDLKFPHHDNECAQSEAFHQHHQWVNYFLHCGHLHIKGLKMSKSLKNFITIRQALDELGVTPRAMRLLFLSFNWCKPMNFSDQSIDEAREKERVLRSFFGSVDIVLRRDPLQQPQGFTTDDRKLHDKWMEAEAAVHAALQNNFDTPAAMEAIMSLVSATNQYLQVTGGGSNSKSPDPVEPRRASPTLIRKVGRYVTKMLRIFGIVGGSDDVGLLTNQLIHNEAGGGAMQGAIAAAMDPTTRFNKVVDALVQFRDEVRDVARAEKQMSAFLPLCDKVRDSSLITAGVRIEDDPSGPSTWKNDDPEILMREFNERKRRESGERMKKLKNQYETKKKLVEKWKQYTTAPVAYFLSQPVLDEKGEAKFGDYDTSTGLPATLASDGSAVDDKTLKKLRKELDKYTKGHEEFLAKGGEMWLKEEQKELHALESQLSSDESK